MSCQYTTVSCCQLSDITCTLLSDSPCCDPNSGPSIDKEDVMSSYFDEHDCVPLSDGAAPDQLLQFARFLVTSGHWNHQEFSAFFADRPPPPTSKQFIDSLPRKVLREESKEDCPICLKRLDQDEEVMWLPCSHQFHSDCLTAWLNKAASCPLCRRSLPTDDPDWEEMKKQKEREARRQEDLEMLHNSMFG